MRLNKTILLVCILLVLFVIKIVPFNINNQSSSYNNLNLATDNTSYRAVVSSKNEFFGKNSSSDNYNFSLLYVVLFDDVSFSLVDNYKSYYEVRINLFDKVVERESLGKIDSNSNLAFLNVKEIGLKQLSYDLSATEFFHLIDDYYKDSFDYNIIVFVPIYEIPWCIDGPSQGFNYQNKVFFCMEVFHNPLSVFENQAAVALMIHKFLHGVGYNHQAQVFKQYVFLDWTMGLPETNGLLHSSFSQFEGLFFDEHTLKVLDILEEDNFESECLDVDGFMCKSSNIYFCKNSWGSFCDDVDSDDLLDSEDNYVFSSPKKGDDSDSDGVVDQLDLCPNNKIIISANDKNTVIGKMNIFSKSNSVTLNFQSDNLNIIQISKQPMKVVEGFISFPEKEITVKNDQITIQNTVGLWRLKVFYEKNKSIFYRPFYVHFTGFDADFIFEKEWYYFNRFGCDISTSVDFENLNSFDKNFDGFPDNNVFLWAKNIDESYDWDDDKVPDIDDTLPTVYGLCKNEFVKGVKDSDNDGLCDPGFLDFKKIMKNPFDIAMSVGKNKNYDFCPYLKGNLTNNGCPKNNWYE